MRSVIVTTQGPSDNTTLPTISISNVNNNTITFSHTELGGSYIPQYTRYVISTSPSSTHNWYNNTDYGSNEPSITLNPTYSWSVTSSSDDAEINSEGVLTIKRNPTANIVVRLTVSNISPLADKTVDFTLTQATPAQSSSSVTTLTTPTMSPTSAALYYNEGSQEFTSSATATKTTTTIPAHTTLTGGGNTYYYYDGTLYSSTNGFSTTVETHPDVTLTWSLSGDAASKLTRTPASGTSTTVTHSTQATADLTATLTVTASATGASDQTATATITAYGPMVAPTITRTGDNISLATTSTGATIYYTTDGNTPTSSSTPYTGPFALTTSPTTVKAITIRDEHSSSVTEQTFTLTLPDPVVSINQSNGQVTITPGEGSPDGVTFHYTTGASPADPTGESAPYDSGNKPEVTNMQYIKVIAIKTGYNSSNVVTALYVNAGLHGDLVILDDREDHSWAYYSDEDCPVHRLNPADIKITYYGYGTSTMTSDNTDGQPANNAFTQTVSSSSVQVNKNEEGNTFVYFKTLEKANDAGTGNYLYTMIPNPFQVRPIYGTYTDGTKASFTGWRGFYAWRVQSLSSGLSIKVGNTTYDADDISDGIIIYAEQEVEFITSNATGNAVAFEALWAKAYVNSDTYISNNGNYKNAYERNFKVGTTLSTNTNPVTFSTLYPDGTGSLGSVTGSNYACLGDVKLENMTLSVSGYINAAGKNLAIGRGVANGNSNVTSNIYGYYSTTTNNSTLSDFNVRIESGKYEKMYALYGTYTTSWGQISATSKSSSNFKCKVHLGSDYDRANDNDNGKLTISDVTEVSYLFTCSSSNALIYFFAYSGTFGDNNSNKELYMGFETHYGNCLAQRFLEVYGGNFLGGIAGGIETGVATATTILSMRIHDGTIHQYLYGAGQFSAGAGSRRTVITGGTFDAWVAGGCYGTNQGGGATDGNIYLYFGGRANQTSTAGIYGAGYGTYGTATGYYTVAQSNVVFADEATTAGSVFGGGNNGYATGNIKVYVAGGTVADDVYGGANEARCGAAVDVVMESGTIEGSLYGGCNTSGDPAGNVTVTVNGGSVGGAIYGCNNVNGSPKQNVTVTINGSDATTTDGSGNKVYALQGVYGGGNQAHYNPTTATNGYPKVIVNGCSTSIKEVYGGGNAAAVPQTDVTINGGDIGSVFAGGNGISNTPANVGYQNKLEPTTSNSYGNGTATVKIYGGTIGQVFGGSNAHGVIRGDISVSIDKSQSTANPKCDMIVREVYGGGNMAESKAASVSIGCTGALTANHNTNPENIGTTLEGIGAVYGGANQANVTSGNIEVNINSGIVANVFGGNNQTGTISGTIEVNIEKTSESNDCDWYVGNVFGGGNLAPYTGSPEVNILNGTVSGNVYGGGKGTLVDGENRGKDGKVTGDPAVTIGDNNNNHTAIVLGDVYGGGDAADVAGEPVIEVIDCNSQVGNVYGGGNAADVDGATITINGGIIGDAFGGGHGDKDASSPSKYADVNGDVTFNVNGGTIARVFAGSNSRGTITGTSSLTINKTGSCAMKIGEVYGGGNEAAGIASSIDIGCTGTLTASHSTNPENIGTTLEGIGYVYGGANQAAISNSIVLNINDGIVANVFGGNNTSGTISGTITVNVEKTGACNWYVGNVFGGGNQAPYTGNPEVNIKNGTVSGNVFGGGNGDPTDNTQVAGSTGAPTVTIGDTEHNTYEAIVLGDVYGGGNAAKVTGNTAPTVQVLNKCNTQIGYVYGGGNAADVPATNVSIAGGSIGNVFGGGHGDKESLGEGHSDKTANVNGNDTITITGGTIGKVYAGSNLNGSITGRVGLRINKGADNCPMKIGEVYGGGDMAESKAGKINIGCTGAWTNSHDSHNSTNNRIGYELEGIGTVYGGANQAAVSSGNIALNINSGIIENVFGGNNTSGAISGTITVNIEKTSESNTCGWYVGNVFGGGNHAPYSSTPDVNIIAGTVSGNVFGGGSEAGVGGGDVSLTGGSVLGGIYGGCNTSGTVSGLITVNLTGGQVGTSSAAADVYGGGLGEATRTTGSINVKLNGSNVYGDIYGGSALGQVNTTTVDILGGTVHQVDGEHGHVFGGGLGQANVYEDEVLTADNSAKGQVNGKVIVNIGATDGEEPPAYTGSATIEGFVFGCNNTNGSPQDDVEVHVYKTGHNTDNRFSDFTNTISENDTLGALAAVAALLESNDDDDVTDGNAFFALKAVYGGGNEADYVPAENKKSTVTIHGCEENTIKYVYGGGCAASVNETHVVIEGGHIYQAFAGGDGSNGIVGANVGYMPDGTTPCSSGTGNTNLAIHGGAVYQAFAGSNTLGTIRGSSSINLNKTCNHQNVYESFIGNNEAPTSGNRTVSIVCGTQWNTVYGGNNKADHTGDITLNITGGKMARVFGGSKSADITGNVTVNVYGGHIGEVFGGNNVSGNIKGTITVNVDINPAYDCADGLALTTVYGGGRDAAYEPFDCFRFSPMVNIKHTSTLQLSEVYGGGYGATAKTVSYPLVIVGGFGDGKVARVYNNVYGGGYGAPVYGNTIAMVRSSIIGNDAGTTGTVFGGGYGTTAVIHGETYVGVFGTSDIKQNVYGGGNAGAVLGSTDVQVAYEEQLLPPETRAVMENGHVYATLVSGTDGASIRYTKDGTAVPTPTTGEEFTGSRFEIDFADNIQAIAYKEGMIPSVVSVNQTPTPSITITGSSAKLSGYIGSKLYYTTDGTEPTTTTGTLYGDAAVDEEGYDSTETISVTANSVIKVLAVMRGCANSHVAYLQAPEPTISFDGANCTITGPAGSRIIYTTFTDTPSGSNPTSAMGGGTEHGTKVSEADDDDEDNTSVKMTIPLTDGETLKAIVEIDGYMPSNISAVKYVAP